MFVLYLFNVVYLFQQKGIKNLKTKDMTTLTNEQIIEKFKRAFYTIKISDCKKSNKGMIVVIKDFDISLFPSYYSAYCFYNNLNLI